MEWYWRSLFGWTVVQDNVKAMIANAALTIEPVYGLSTALILPPNSSIRLQQTEIGQILPADKYTLSEQMRFGACHTNEAYLGNPAEAD